MLRLLAALLLVAGATRPCEDASSCAAVGSAFVQRTADIQRTLAEHSEDELSEGSRRRSRRRRRRKSSRRRSSKSRRRSSNPTPSPSPAPRPAPRPAPLVADAAASKVEGGWADMVTRGDSFTVFVLGSGFDPKKDRIVVLDGDATCGAPSARLGAVLETGEVPGTDFDAWKRLSCSNVGSSASKLACGAGDGKGVKYFDDGFVDYYDFKVCVCDFSKAGNCDTMERFDLTPATPTLTLNPKI